MVRRLLLLLLVLFVAIQLFTVWRFALHQWAASNRQVVERAQQMAARARPEYQEFVLATLPENPKTGPFLRLDRALEQAVVLKAPAAVPTDLVSDLLALEFDNPQEPAFAPANGAPPPAVVGGRLQLRATEGGYYVLDGLTIARDDVGQIWIRMRASGGNFLRLGWQSDGSIARGERLWRSALDLRFRDLRDFHTYVIDARKILKRGLAPGEAIRRLLLQPADVEGAEVEIDWIRFVGRAAPYASAVRGTGFESIAEDTRPVLFMWPSQSLAWPLTIPNQDPRFDAAVAVLFSGRPLQFALRLLPAEGEMGEPVLLWQQEVANSEGWQEIRVDLSAYAGERRRLVLEVEGDPRNVALWASPMVSAKPREPLRIILLVEDALRPQSLSLYGYPRPTTPFKERLAERAIVFERAFAQATETRASVASLMTGLYPSATGLWHFTDVLSERHLTLAELLRAQGYITGAFVQNGNASPYAGQHQGFDSMRSGPELQGRAERLTIDAEVVAWLERHRDRNSFLYLHILDPHAPYDPPEGLRQPEEGKPLSSNPTFDPPWVTAPTLEGRRQRYEAEILHNDRVLEQFFAMLAERGLAPNTLVVLTADHGEFLGERGLLGNRLWGHRPPGYPEVTRVPLLFVWPERFGGGRRIAVPVGLIDLAPTLLELAGVSRENLLLHGDSLVPLLEGRELEGWRQRVVVSEEPHAMRKDAPCTACGSLFFGEWQLLASPYILKRSWVQGFEDGVGLLFTHLRPSLGGGPIWPSLLALYPRWLHWRTFAALHAADFQIWQKITRGEGGDGLIEPETLEQLRGLGYVQ